MVWAALHRGKSQPLREYPGGLRAPEWRPFSRVWRATVQVMTPELIGILSVGAALAAFMAGMVTWLRADIRQVRADLSAEIGQVRADVGGLRTDVRDVDRRLDALTECVARIEVAIFGLNGRQRREADDRGEGRAA